MNNLLYIGLNGYAGSGKDTVAKMLNTILNYNWNSKTDAYEAYKNIYVQHKKMYATLDNDNIENNCMCIAFADQLKKICSVMFGIPVKYFYYNKGTAWICINKDFSYTEMQPNKDNIITAEDFYSCKDTYFHSNEKYYMSLREILVYIGTYVCQYDINKSIFVNIVNNEIQNKIRAKSTINYVICTDVRFLHEYNYIYENNGIMINIVRNSINQMENIAEHDLDVLDVDNFDFTIYNDGTYEQLFDNVWDLVQNNLEFRNVILELPTRDNCNNFLRLIYNNNNKKCYKLCYSNGISRINHTEDGNIYSINLIGGPEITVNELIENTDILVKKIFFDNIKNEYLIVS